MLAVIVELSSSGPAGFEGFHPPAQIIELFLDGLAGGGRCIAHEGADARSAYDDPFLLQQVYRARGGGDRDAVLIRKRPDGGKSRADGVLAIGHFPA